MNKILFINGHLNSGGVERSLVDILRHMDYSKYEVDLLLLEDTGDYLSELPEQVNVIFRDIHNTYGSFITCVARCLKTRDFRNLWLRFLIVRKRRRGLKFFKPAARLLLGEHHYDCVIGFRPGICSELAAFAVEAERRYTWWHHGEMCIDPAYYSELCEPMDNIVAVSQSCKAMLQMHCPELEKRLVCIPNMLDVDTILSKVGDNPYQPGYRHLVTVARLTPEKHLENIIPCMRNLLERGQTDLRWHIIGDGPERENLEEKIHTNGLDHYIRMEGNQPNPYPYIAYAYLMVHPSYIESQGLTPLEAMALGVPCVVTRSSGTEEYAIDGVNALQTDRSAESLSEKVLQILEDRNLYFYIRENSVCPDQFRKDCVIEKIEKLIG